MNTIKPVLLRIKDVQVILGCSRSFVVQLMDSGKLSKIMLTPSSIRIPASSVTEYLASIGITATFDNIITWEGKAS